MDETEIDLRGIFGLLRRQIRLILITVVAVVAIAGFVAYSLTPVYSTSALILVDPSRKNLLEPDPQMGSSASDNARIDSEVEILRSDNILLKVIQAENLTSDPNIGVSLSLRDRILMLLRIAEPTPPTGEDLVNEALNNLRNAISIQRRGLTYLISVQARSVDPAQAASLANAVAQTYIEDQLASKVNSTLASRDILQARIIQARDAIVRSEGSYDAYIDANLARITADTGRTDIAQIQQQIRQLNEARTSNSRIAETVQTGLATNDWQSVVGSLQSSAVAELDRQRSELAARLEGAGPNSALAVDLNQELASIEDQIRAAASDEVTALQESITAAETQETNLRQDLRRTVLDGSLSPDILTELYELQQNAELARSQYQTLLARTQELETQADLQLADSRIVSPALPPQVPSFPNKLLIIALAGLASIGLGVALAFLYENFIGGFHSEAQLASVLKTRVAAAIPRQKARSERETLANLMITSPLSVYAESVRRLRATLDQLLRSRTDHSGGIVVVITSTTPNEGKTTVALSLARSYALSGKKTLLIDCDLRKPSVHRHLGIDPSQGLLEYLASNDSENLNAIISRDSMSAATIIVGARRSDLPTDQLLTGKSFANLVSAARRAFDVVVLDTPPVGPVVDGLYIAPFADTIVFVTRWSATSQLDAKQAFNSLAEVKAENAEIVAVINQQDETRASYMRKYGNYYSETD